MNKKGIEKYNYTLTYENIDDISSKVIEYLESVNIEEKKIAKIRLSIEECLLFWRESNGENTKITLCLGRKIFGNHLSIEAKTGKPMNPYLSEEDDRGEFTSGILSNMGLYPKYVYKNGLNLISFRLKKKLSNPFKRLGLVLAFSIITGLLTKLIIPQNIIESLLNFIINPVYDTFFNILGCIAGPMVFLSVAWGIYGIGDVATLSNIGKKLMAKYIGIVLVCSSLGLLFFSVLGPGKITSDGATTHTSGILELLLGVFPSNIISPFENGNTLQIIFLAFVLGIVLLFLDAQTESLAIAIEQLNNVVQFLMELISRIVPYFIFVVIVQLIWSEAYEAVLSMSKLVAVFVPSALAFVLIYIIIISLEYKIRPLRLIRKLTPGFLIAITTASSAASFDTVITTCEKKLGLDPSVSRFGIPLGFVICKPTTGFIYVLFALSFADQYNVSCSLGWIFTAVLVSVVLSIATPPTPGSGIAAYALLFSQLGIPEVAITFALTFDMLADFVMTACDITMLELSLASATTKTGKVNMNTFRH